MATPVSLRADFSGLWGLAKASKQGNVTRRLLALAEIYDGAPRGDAARLGGVGLQTVCDWVLRFKAKGLHALKDGKVPGQTPKLNERKDELWWRWSKQVRPSRSAAFLLAADRPRAMGL